MGATLVCLAAGGLAVGCGPATPNADDVTTVTIGESEDPNAVAHWKRLYGEPLEGLARVWADEVFYPTEAAARKARPKRRKPDGKGTAIVHITEDLGDVVKIRTWLSPRVRDGMEAITSYDLNVYAHEHQLLPVLRNEVRKTFEDGSGYVFYEGFHVVVADEVRPHASLDGNVSIPIRRSAVGLSFPLRGKDEALEGPRGEGLVCKRRRGGYDERDEPDGGEQWVELVTRSEQREQDRREARRERERRRARGEDTFAVPMGLAFAGGMRATCSFITSREKTSKSHALTLGGTKYASAQNKAGSGCHEVWFSPHLGVQDGQVLVDYAFERAILRVVAQEHSLRAPGGCGGIAGMGFGGSGRGRKPPPPKMVLAAKDKVKVYFPSGAHAGYHMSGVTKMAGAVRRRGMFCIEHDNVTTRLCFKKDDLVKVPE